MADKPKKSPRYSTPIGIARWAHLNEPDEYQGVIKFKTELILSAEDAAKITDSDAFRAAVTEAERLRDETLAKAAEKKGGKKPKEQDYVEAFFAHTDRESGEETGDVVFRFASNATYKDKKGEEHARTIPFFNAKGQAIPEDDKPGVRGGSRLRVSYSLYPYHNAGANNYGVSLRLEGVKIIELGVGGRDAGSFGFGGDDSSDDDAAPDADNDGADATAAVDF